MSVAKRNLILSGIAIIIVSVISYSFIKNHDFLPKNNVWSNNTTKTTEQKEPEQPLAAMDMNTKVSTFGMTYKVNNVKRTKNREMLPILGDLYEFVKVDQQGTIINEYSYLIVNLSIENNLDTPQEFNVGSYRIYARNEKGLYQDGFETSLFDKRDDIYAKDYFFYTLQPKENITLNIGYIGEDKLIDKYKDSLDYVINNGGTRDLGDKNVRIIKINYN